MAGTLTATTIQNDTSSPPTFRNNSAEIGQLCRAWVQYNAVTQTIAGSFNVSSVTFTSTGFFTINFARAMPNANYSLVGTAGYRDGTNNAEPAFLYIRRLNTAQYDVNGCAITTYFAGGVGNCVYTNVAVFSS